MPNRAWFLDSPRSLKLKEMPMPEPKSGEVQIKIAANGLCGSDIHFYLDGKLGSFKVTEPYVPGHEASGTVSAVGKGCKHLREGDKVALEPGIPCGLCKLCKEGRYNLCAEVIFMSAPPINGTFCEYVSLPEHLAFKMPDNLSLEVASLAEPAAVGVQAVKQAKANLWGLTGLIVGAGPIGLMCLQAFKAAGGGRAICVDFVEKRLEIAKTLGADMVCKPGDPALSAVADVVFECTGSTKATEQLFSHARHAGSIVQVGYPQDSHVSIDITRMMDLELNYTGVFRYNNCYDAAIAWLADGRIKSEGIITHRFPFEEADKAFEWTANNKESSIKTVVLC